MGARSIGLVAVLFLPFGSGCACFCNNRYPPSPTEESRVVYVVSHGWHAGLVLPRDQISSAVWPEHLDLPRTKFVEVGWGSGVFYMAPQVTPAVALRAMCWSDSVLHVAGFNGPPEQVFPESQVIAVRLSERGFEELCRTIHESYVPDAQGQPIALGAGLYGESQFYQARGKYYFPNTCNAWTARALYSAGCPIEPAISATALAVVMQASRFGERVRRDE